jgi:hypothetical protein
MIASAAFALVLRSPPQKVNSGETRKTHGFVRQRFRIEHCLPARQQDQSIAIVFGP